MGDGDCTAGSVADACRDLIADSIEATRFEFRKAVGKHNTFRPHHALKGKTPMEYLRITQAEAA